MKSNNYKIGLDLGSTHLDYVILKNNTIFAMGKCLGVLIPNEHILFDILKNHPQTPVCISTTHVLNQWVQGTNLKKIGLLRLAGLHTTRALSPGTLWDKDRKKAILKGFAYTEGGFDWSGKSISPLNMQEIYDHIMAFKAQGAEVLILSSVWGQRYPQHEEQVKELCQRKNLFQKIICSGHFQGLGLIERENNGCMDGALFQSPGLNALKNLENQLQIPLKYITPQGNAVELECISENPYLAVGSGPLHALKGFGKINKQDAVVADIGGTTTDLGVVRGGQPMVALRTDFLGGIPLRLWGVHTVSLNLGGGTPIISDSAQKEFVLHKKSLGIDVFQGGFCFGGHTPTLTDAGVTLGYCKPPGVVRNWEKDLSRSALTQAFIQILNATDTLCSDRNRPLALLGGGAALFPQDLTYDIQKSRPGEMRPILRPPNGASLNALGTIF